MEHFDVGRVELGTDQVALAPVGAGNLFRGTVLLQYLQGQFIVDRFTGRFCPFFQHILEQGAQLGFDVSPGFCRQVTSNF